VPVPSRQLTMPILVLAGEKASGEFLITLGCLVDDKVEGVVIKGAGHCENAYAFLSPDAGSVRLRTPEKHLFESLN
jgi:hypothetical protein